MNRRKVSWMCLVAVAVLTLNVMPVDAQEWEQSFTVSTGFTEKWSKSYTFEFILDEYVSQYMIFTYGYDTWWVKEDYVKEVCGVPQGYYGKGRVTNSEGTAMETAYIPSGYKSGKADVKHTGDATYTGFLKDS